MKLANGNRRWTLAKLAEHAKTRPAGYRDNVLELATNITDTHFELTEIAWGHLREKYRRCGGCDKGAAAKLVHGAKGLAKAVLGIDRADDETIASREAICRGCDQLTPTGGLVNRCKACGCALAAKVRLNGESCPIGKWPAVTK